MRLTSKERIARILKHEPVDRVGLFEVFSGGNGRELGGPGPFRETRDGQRSLRPRPAALGGEITPGAYRTVNLVADLDARQESG